MKPSNEYARNRREMQGLARDGQTDSAEYRRLQDRNDVLHLILTCGEELARSYELARFLDRTAA